jgi:hypothetical protein
MTQGGGTWMIRAVTRLAAVVGEAVRNEVGG